MVARVWHGVAPESKSKEHLTHIQQELLRAYREAAGNRGAILLSRRRTVPWPRESILLKW